MDRNTNTYRPSGPPPGYRPTGDARNPSTYRPTAPPAPPVNVNRQAAGSYRPTVTPNRNTAQSYRPTGNPHPAHQSQGWRQTQTSNNTQNNASRETAYTFDYRHTQDIADVNRQTAYTYRSDNRDASRDTAWTFRTQNTDPNRLTTNTYRKGGKKRGRSSRFSMLSMDLMMGITPAVPEPPSVRVPTYYQEFNRKSRFSKYLSVNGPVWRPSGADSQSNLRLGDIDEEAEGYYEEEEEEYEAYSIYTPLQKTFLVVGNAFIAFVGALTVQMYLPALNVLAEELDVSSSMINLTVTAFLAFQGISPLIFSGFTDIYGRRPGYIICFIIYVASSVVLALSDRYSITLAMRSVQSIGTSTIMILSQAAVADIVTSAERPQYIGITSIPTILGPSLGPVIGGALVQTLKWRSIFWFLAIYAGFTFFAVVIFMPETCRKIVGDGSIRPHKAYYTVVQGVQWRDSKEKPIENVASLEPIGNKEGESGAMFALRTLFSSVALFGYIQLVLLITAAGLAFGAVYALSTAAPSIFQDEYGLTALQVGLMYLPMAVGSIIAVVIVGPGMNYNYHRHAAMAGVSVDEGEKMDLDNFPIEKARLEIAIPLLVLGVGVIAGFGWALQYHAHLGVIATLIFLFGISIVGINNAIQVLIVDIFFDQAGAALATNNFMKCALGAASSAVVAPMIDKIGFGWSFTVFGGIYGLLIPLLMIVMWKGADWRPRPN